MDISIRSEDFKDFNDVSELTTLAFEKYSNDGFIGEVQVINSLRSMKNYDKNLSLVAEKDNKIIGHALFFPYKMNINNKMVKALSLGPISVHPDHQNMKIGSLLIKRGHEIAREKGLDLVFLIKHTNYYTRFGYIKNMFGKSLLKIERNSIKRVKSNIV